MLVLAEREEVVVTVAVKVAEVFVVERVSRYNFAVVAKFLLLHQRVSSHTHPVDCLLVSA